MPGWLTYADNAAMVLRMTWDSPTNNELLRENRTLRWQAKQLGKQLGKQGRTIFQLRNECASLRIANQLTPPHDAMVDSHTPTRDLDA